MGRQLVDGIRAGRGTREAADDPYADVMMKTSMGVGRRRILPLAMAMSMVAVAACAGDGVTTGSDENGATVRPAVPAVPVGVYAHVNVNDALSALNGSGQDLTGLYDQLLSNPAIAGLAIGVHWDDVEPIEGAFEIDNVTRALREAQKVGKNVIVQLSPGTHTPAWMFDWVANQPPVVPSCDGLWGSADDIAATPSNCGSVTFEQYPEQHGGGPAKFPVPWNQTYRTQWKKFLTTFNDYYSTGAGAAYGSAIVAVSIAGPTGASPEIILPNTTFAQTGSGPTSGVSAMQVWQTLLDFERVQFVPSEQDRPFVNAWDNAIDDYNAVFDAITLILTPDNGHRLPAYGLSTPDLGLGSSECFDGDLSCPEVANIMSHQLSASVVNAPGFLMGGMTASAPVATGQGDIGVSGIKYLTTHGSTSMPIVGGSEFDHALTNGKAIDETNFCATAQPAGSPCPTTAEEGIYNLMTVFFYDTPGGGDFAANAVLPGGVPLVGPDKMQFLFVDYNDVIYASNIADPVPVATGCVTAEYELQLAAYWLDTINGISATRPAAPTCQ